MDSMVHVSSEEALDLRNRIEALANFKTFMQVGHRRGGRLCPG